MPSAVSGVKAAWISVQVRMTLAEHQALQRLVHDTGHGSYQSYLRTLLVERLRDAGALPPPQALSHHTA
jgi:hypothetical protein